MAVFSLFGHFYHKILTETEEMNEFSSGTKLQVFVVGGSTDEFVRQIMDMPGSGNIEFVFCEDVYSAAGRAMPLLSVGLSN